MGPCGTPVSGEDKHKLTGKFINWHKFLSVCVVAFKPFKFHTTNTIHYTTVLYHHHLLEYTVHSWRTFIWECYLRYLSTVSNQEPEFQWVYPSIPLSPYLSFPLQFQSYFPLPRPLQAQSTNSLSRVWTWVGTARIFYCSHIYIQILDNVSLGFVIYLLTSLSFFLVEHSSNILSTRCWLFLFFLGWLSQQQNKDSRVHSSHCLRLQYIHDSHKQVPFHFLWSILLLSWMHCKDTDGC